MLPPFDCSSGNGICPAHGSVGQTSAALRTTAGQDLAAIAGGHTLTEAVLLGTLALLGLIGTKHGGHLLIRFQAGSPGPTTARFTGLRSATKAGFWGGINLSPHIPSTDYYRRKYFSLSTIFFPFLHLFSIPMGKTQHLVFILPPPLLLGKFTDTIKIKNALENQGERLAAKWFFCYNDDDELRPFPGLSLENKHRMGPLPNSGRQGPHFHFFRFSPGPYPIFWSCRCYAPALLFKEVFP